MTSLLTHNSLTIKIIFLSITCSNVHLYKHYYFIVGVNTLFHIVLHILNYATKVMFKIMKIEIRKPNTYASNFIGSPNTPINDIYLCLNYLLSH